MNSLERDIREIAPQLYQAQAEAMGIPAWTDMSRSHQCQPMSHHMMQALQRRDYSVRRELHQDESGNLHNLQAHGDEPTERELLTDLNPWQYGPETNATGLLHAPRDEVMARLRQERAPEFFVALRGLETIVAAHKPDW